jgi:hypothetical protein
VVIVSQIVVRERGGAYNVPPFLLVVLTFTKSNGLMVWYISLDYNRNIYFASYINQFDGTWGDTEVFE